MSRYEITLSVPDRRLHPNARTHWRPKASATATRRQAVSLIALSELAGAKRPLLSGDVAVRCFWSFKTKRKRDRDGLTAWLKATIDGLVDAGLMADDDRLHWLGHEIWVKPEQVESVTLGFSEIDVALLDTSR